MTLRPFRVRGMPGVFQVDAALVNEALEPVTALELLGGKA